MDLLQLTTKFDEKLIEEYKKYLEYHKQLDTWRGKELDDIAAMEVNTILKNIQDQFILLSAAFNILKQRAELAHKATTEFQYFIDSLKVSNAVNEQPRDDHAVS